MVALPCNNCVTAIQVLPRLYIQMFISPKCDGGTHNIVIRWILQGLYQHSFHYICDAALSEIPATPSRWSHHIRYVMSGPAPVQVAQYEKQKRENVRLAGEVERLEKEVLRQKSLRYASPPLPPSYHSSVFIQLDLLVL